MMAQMEPRSDTKLVERHAGGDRESLARIVERYQGLIGALAYNAWGG